MKAYLDNFRQYPVEQLIHFGVGAGAGWLLTNEYETAGAVIMAVVLGRQIVEWGNRALLPRIIRLVKGQFDLGPEEYDTPGIDLAFHLAGLLTGIVTGLAMNLPI